MLATRLPAAEALASRTPYAETPHLVLTRDTLGLEAQPTGLEYTERSEVTHTNLTWIPSWYVFIQYQLCSLVNLSWFPTQWNLVICFIQIAEGLPTLNESGYLVGEFSLQYPSISYSIHNT